MHYDGSTGLHGPRQSRARHNQSYNSYVWRSGGTGYLQEAQRILAKWVICAGGAGSFNAGGGVVERRVRARRRIRRDIGATNETTALN